MNGLEANKDVVRGYFQRVASAVRGGAGLLSSEENSAYETRDGVAVAGGGAAAPRARRERRAEREPVLGCRFVLRVTRRPLR